MMYALPFPRISLDPRWGSTASAQVQVMVDLMMPRKLLFSPCPVCLIGPCWFFGRYLRRKQNLFRTEVHLTSLRFSEYEQMACSRLDVTEFSSSSVGTDLILPRVKKGVVITITLQGRGDVFAALYGEAL